jgi:hypothetical protein
VFNSLIFIFTKSNPSKDLLWRKSFLLLARLLNLTLIYVSVLSSSGKSTACLFHSSHFDCPLKSYEGYAHNSYGCGSSMWYL